MKGYFKYSVEMFRDGQWELEFRFYRIKKDLNSQDLFTHSNRRNAKLIE